MVICFDKTTQILLMARNYLDLYSKKPNHVPPVILLHFSAGLFQLKTG